MRVLIVGDAFSFPHGTGAASRVRSYACGIRSAGTIVDVACLKCTESSVLSACNTVSSGSYRSIPYTYLCGSPVRSQSFLSRRLSDLRSAFSLISRILSLGTQHRKDPSAVLLYSDTPFWTSVTIITAMIVRIPVYIDICEFPSVNITNKIRKRLRYFSQVIINYTFIRGFIVISYYLQNWLVESGVKPERILLVPPMVDLQDWSSPSTCVRSTTPSILYTGNLGHREELNLLWEAFRIVARIESSVVLRIVGGLPGEPALADLQASAVREGLSHRLDLMGWLPHDQQRTVIQSATICVLPRRRGLFSTAGVPNKLAEYLAAGRPIVASAVGDIPVYVENGKSGILVSPEVSPTQLADSLLYLLRNPYKAEAMGMSGRMVAEKLLDVSSNGKRIASFMNS